MRVIKLAEKYLKYFSRKTRDNGETFCFIEGKNGEDITDLSDLVYECHDTNFPNDWVYETVHECLTYISEAVDENELENLDIEADLYTKELFEWGAQFYEYCDEYQSEFGTDRDTTVLQLLQFGNWYHKKKILDTVIYYLREKVEEETED